MKKISLIVAMDRSGAIGRDGDMPWHLPADLAHFKRTTLGHPVIMGRRTFESIGRPLPGRLNIVLTRRIIYQACDGVHVVDSIEKALALSDSERVFVIGGGEIYEIALPLAHELFVTRIDTEVADADTWFPEISAADWREQSRERRPADSRNAYDLEFIHFARTTG